MTRIWELAYEDLTQPCTAPRCEDGTVYSLAWDLWWKEHHGAQGQWEREHPGGDWHTSRECEAHEAMVPREPRNTTARYAAARAWCPTRPGTRSWPSSGVTAAADDQVAAAK